jgi:cobalt-zinc-cadmium efflux system membrane fusion protein
MAWQRSKVFRVVGFTLLVCFLVGITAAASRLSAVQDWLKPSVASERSTTSADSAKLADMPYTIRLPAALAAQLGVEVHPVQRATRSRPLKLDGSLAFDPDWIHRCRARFAGEVVQIARVPSEHERTSSGETLMRPLRTGDRVAENELVAVVWSKELGEKKSELVDAELQLRLDRFVLKELQQASAAIPSRTLQDAQRKVENDSIAVERARRTLGVFRVTADDMEAIEKEVERLFLLHGKSEAKASLSREERQDLINTWARVEVRAPFAGYVVERNVAKGDIVDTSTDIFKIARTDQLLVQANAYEQALPALLALTPEQRRWSIRLLAEPDAPPVEGTIDKIRQIVDPNTQTVFVVGQVANPSGRLRAGQWITATIELPPPPGVVAVPPDALVEDGTQSVVLVQLDPAKPEYTLRRVVVAQRLKDVIFVKSELSPDERTPTPQPQRLGLLPPEPLTEGQLVVTAGAVELKAELEEKLSEAKAKAKTQP